MPPLCQQGCEAGSLQLKFFTGEENKAQSGKSSCGVPQWVQGFKPKADLSLFYVWDLEGS